MVLNNVREMYMLVFGALILGLMIVLVINFFDVLNGAQTADTLASNSTSSWLETVSITADIFSVLFLVLIFIIIIFFMKVLQKGVTG